MQLQCVCVHVILLPRLKRSIYVLRTVTALSTAISQAVMVRSYLCFFVFTSHYAAQYLMEINLYTYSTVITHFKLNVFNETLQLLIPEPHDYICLKAFFVLLRNSYREMCSFQLQCQHVSNKRMVSC